MAVTLMVHSAVVGVLWSAPALVRETALPVYNVELVAAPRPQPQQRRAPEAVERPAEQPAPVSPRPRPQRTSVAETPPPPTPEREREPAPRTTPDVELAPDAEPSTGSDPATVKTSGGVDFRYPEYLRNIVAQVHRRWHRPSGNVSLRAEVLFFVHRDGSISNFQFVRRSGNFGFDLEAQGAIEAAANAGAFGPLPEGYPADVLPVSFFFDPSAIR
jgi:outer membrane biosynthesis protein TonB